MAVSLWMPALWFAVQARLATDAVLVHTSTGLLGPNGALNIRSFMGQPGADPPGTSYPNIQIWPLSDANDDTFDGRRLVQLFTVRVNVLRETETSGYSYLLTLAKIHERIVGDWPEQADRAPTYGLDRWKGTFVGQTGDSASTYTPETMIYRGFNNVSDDSDDVVRWDATFDVPLIKKRP